MRRWPAILQYYYDQSLPQIDKAAHNAILGITNHLKTD